MTPRMSHRGARGQQFTPILATSHKASVSLFQLGQPASSELATLAEEGNTAPLAAALDANPGVDSCTAAEDSHGSAWRPC